MDTKKLLDQLNTIPINRLYNASFKAVTRLQLYFTSWTHERLLEFGRDARSAILRAGGRDGVLDGASGFAVQSELLRLWGDTMTEWQAEFQRTRREAAWIPFGVLAVTHERMLKPVFSEAVISDQLSAINEALNDGIFAPQVRILLQVAENYLYGGTNLNLSGRIWQLDRESRDAINAVLMDAIANGKSAWDTAKALEDMLGANADCPRWTSTRLYGMTAKEKTTSTTGLLSGDACDGRGVSYNALRLARTEIQKMHALATDKMMAMQPWVLKEQIHLSAAHPERDECDDVVAGGENGDGIYPKGEIELPIHPNCFCFKTAVMMNEKEFTSRLRGWMNGSEPWGEMDEYEKTIGGDVQNSIMPQAIGLAVWLLSTELAEWMK